jgi:hypothetical protein
MSTTYNITLSLLDIFKIFDICKKVSWRLSRCEQSLFLLKVPICVWAFQKQHKVNQ